MKQVVALALLASLPAVARAGVSYRFETVTTGIGARAMSGTVEVEGDRSRIDIEHGDGAVFADHTFALTSPGGSRLTVVDPSTRTYYEIGAGDLAGGGALLDQLRATFALKVTGARASARDLGAGPAIEGYPTRHFLLETSCGIVAAADSKPRLTYATTTETWSTDRIPAAYATVLLSSSAQTGLPEVDGLIPKQAGAKGFPLKQISTTRIVQNGTPVEVRATTIVSAIRTRPIAPVRFALPAGYTKTANPIETVMRALGSSTKP